MYHIQSTYKEIVLTSLIRHIKLILLTNKVTCTTEPVMLYLQMFLHIPLPSAVS